MKNHKTIKYWLRKVCYFKEHKGVDYHDIFTNTINYNINIYRMRRKPFRATQTSRKSEKKNYVSPIS